MLSILINAYACSPGMGSEPGMAWNWCVNLAKHCELHIITEGEFRDKIEEIVPTLPQRGNMHFYYNPIGDNEMLCAKIRKMCWNQGDWRFYKYYQQWQWKTYLKAKEICTEQHIDVLHQLNMIGFREPGYLWKLSKETDIPFVWGPIGGLKQYPLKYTDGGGLKMKLFMALKNTINIWQLKYDKRVNAAFEQASLLISSIPNSYNAIKKYKGLESVIIPETGCFDIERSPTKKQSTNNDYFRIVWVGKFDFRKRLDIALEAIASAYHKDMIFEIYGTGNEKQIKYYKQLCDNLGISDIVAWKGNRSNEEVKASMKSANLFFFTSVNEDTSTVVLEAVSCSLPVLCFDACGMSAVIDDTVGRKVPLSTPSQSVKDFAEKIELLYNNRDVLKRMSENCRERQLELSWDRKAQQMVELYEQIIKK